VLKFTPVVWLLSVQERYSAWLGYLWLLATHRRTKLIGYQASEIGHEQTLMKANFTRQNNNKQIQRATCLEKEISKLA
jgi:hypothetical protein